MDSAATDYSLVHRGEGVADDHVPHPHSGMPASCDISRDALLSAEGLSFSTYRGFAGKGHVIGIMASHSFTACVCACVHFYLCGKQFMENVHSTILIKSFVEAFVVCAPRSCYSTVSVFLAALLRTTLRRLSFAWDSSFTSPPFQTDV